MKLDEKYYLGDAVYAKFDGHQVWLTTEDGISTTNEIALEPSVILAFERHIAMLRAVPLPSDKVPS